MNFMKSISPNLVSSPLHILQHPASFNITHSLSNLHHSTFILQSPLSILQYYDFQYLYFFFVCLFIDFGKICNTRNGTMGSEGTRITKLYNHSGFFCPKNSQEDNVSVMYVSIICDHHSEGQ